MADVSLIAVTSRMKEAGSLINSIDEAKFPFLLTRIIQKLHLRNESIFSEAEHEQLCGRFNLSDGELTTVLEALSYVFEQAAYHTIRPAALPPLLEAALWDATHSAAVGKAWEEGAASIVASLKEHTMTGPKTLVGSQYRLHLVMAESNLSRLQDPVALFELALAPTNNADAAATPAPATAPASKSPGSSSSAGKAPSAATSTSSVPGPEALALEFTHSELYDFFQKLERVQEQLDALG